MSLKKRQAQPPEKLTGIQLKKIPESAVGVKAIKSALSHINREVGLGKGVGLLAKLNQTDESIRIKNPYYDEPITK